jgi:hypothetical protein
MIAGYVMLFFSGAFLCNAIPHLAAGLQGRSFPTPFAQPRGIGHSPAFTNFLWGAANLLIAIFLMTRTWADNLPHGLMVAALGFLLLGAFCSRHFAKHGGGYRPRP